MHWLLSNNKAIKSVSDRKTKLKKVEIINKEKKVRFGNITYFKPNNLKELKDYLEEKSFQFIAGGTDLNLQRPII